MKMHPERTVAGAWILLCCVAFGGEFHTEDLSVWVHDDATEIRAVIVHRHYGAGNQLYYKAAWRDFATRENLAMVLLTPSHGKRKKDPVHLKQGAHDVQRLYAGLAQAAKVLKIPRLAKAPFVPTGVSRGGANGIAMVYAAPDRALAAIGYHGESVIGSEQFGNGALQQVPVLYTLAANDPKRNARVFAYVMNTMRLKHDAPWTLIVQPDCRHNSTGDDRFVLPWLSAVLRQRLTDQGTLAPINREKSTWGGGQLQGGRTSAAFLSNVGLRESRQDPPSPVTWLPDAALGRLWVEYHAGGAKK